MKKTKRRNAYRQRINAKNEPKISTSSSDSAIIHAYNFYNDHYTSDDAKSFILEYLRKIKKPKEYIKKISQAPSWECRTLGWHSRMLMNGGTLPKKLIIDFNKRLGNLEQKIIIEKEEVAVVKAPVQSNGAGNYIARLEEDIDSFLRTEEVPELAWLKQSNLNARNSKIVFDFYSPLYSELVDALGGKEKDLKEAYSGWKKPALKKYIALIKEIMTICENTRVVSVKNRKPRKKKVKTADELTKKVKYQKDDKELGFESVPVGKIIGSQQLWAFNTKTRTLTVLNALGEAGLSVKGTTVLGFDPKTSKSKKVRKPKETLQKLTSGGKVALRNLMEELSTKETEPNGRINSCMLLVRIL